MRMDIETFAYDVLEGLKDGEVCCIISPTYKKQQLEKVKEISPIPFKVFEIGLNAEDGYMLDPSKCGVDLNGKLVHKGSYFECKRYIDKNCSSNERIVLLEPEYEHFCFKEYPNESPL